MASQYGIKRFDHELEAKGYDDATSHYTPAWQEQITGVKADVVAQVGREFAQNAIDTKGRSMIIMGAGINHWFNSDTIYRAVLNLVLLCGCQGVNGGGWAHYVGQEKCRPIEGWNTVAFAKDWQGPPRLQNGTSWFYFATDQWKYEESFVDKLKSPLAKDVKHKHPADYNVTAAKLGWLPSYPQFNKTVYCSVKKRVTKVNLIMKQLLVKRLKQLKIKTFSLRLKIQMRKRTIRRHSSFGVLT